MKIALIHLTDIHFTEKTVIENKTHSLVRAIINDVSGIENIYFILSGDIAFSGKKEEYQKAKSFLSVTKQLLTSELKSPNVKYVIVPGNHDCNFGLNNSQARKSIIQNINYATIGTDNSVADLCITVQNDFWEFYLLYNELPTDKLYYVISDKIGEKQINFICLNTAWVSQLNEVPSGLFYPVKRYEKKISKNEGIRIGVWHHPYNWFNPNTSENNKAEFENFTEEFASTHFFGHEHVQSAYITENKNSGNKINLLSGQVFNDDKKPENSGFQTFIIG